MIKSNFINPSEYNLSKYNKFLLQKKEWEYREITSIHSSLYYDFKKLDQPITIDCYKTDVLDLMKKITEVDLSKPFEFKEPLFDCNKYFKQYFHESAESSFCPVEQDSKIVEIKRLAEELRSYKARFKKSPDFKLLQKITALVKELHGLIGITYKATKAQLLLLRKQIFHSVVRNIRDILSVFVKKFFSGDIASGDEDANGYLYLNRYQFNILKHPSHVRYKEIIKENRQHP